MKYMLLIYADAEQLADPGAEDRHEAWMRITQEMAPITDAGAQLQPISTATTVRVAGGETVLTDGPFAETKEVLAGYYVIDVPDLDTAVEWASRLPIHDRGSVEIRPLVQVPAAA